MKLRNISIGLSVVVMIGIVGIWVFAMGGPAPNNFDSLFSLLFICVVSVLPQVVSIVISVCVKHSLSQIFSAIVSLLHGYCFAAYSIMGFLAHLGTPLILPMLWFLLMPVILPLWIAAIVIEWRYRKKNKPILSEP